MGHSQRRRIEEQVAREALLALTLLGIAMVQAAIFPRVLGAPPNLILLLVICRSLLVGPASGARWALYGGIGLDICAGTPIGMHALALLAAALTAALLLIRISRGNWLLPLLGTFFGATVYYAVIGALTSLLIAPVDLELYLRVAAIPGLVVAIIPSLPVYLGMRWLEQIRRGEVPIDVY